MKSLLILGAFISLFAMSFGGEADSGEHIVDVDDLSEDLTKDLGSDAEDFKKFNKKFNKRIKKKDFGKAAAAFKKNNKKLKALQEKHKGKKFTFKMNRFMALPEEEFKENVLLSPRAMKFNKNTRAIDRKKAKEMRQAKRKSKQEARKAARMAKRKERLGAKKAGKLVQEKVLRKGKKNHKREAEQEVTTEETTTPEWTVVYEYDDGTTEEEPYDPRIDNKLPEQFDWRDYGVITPVKDQGSCGSCWTFSAIGVLEAQHARKHPGELLDLSEQQIITCVSLDRENICKGGASENVFEYFMNASLVSETEQPYAPSKLIAPRDAGCKKVTKPLVKVASHISLLGSTVDEIKDALIQDGPISVGAYLNDEFDYWGGGIFTVPCTEANTGGHAMLIVGYGKEDGIPYWIIRNSWGTDWGENGYIRWKMGEDLCNVESRRLNQAQIV